ncbi:acyl-CoA dehydrogenase family protein [Hyphomonas johnsonii]|uniref:Acyl-CoA dehydrogenase domain-containing protein n=1 Tax=Hyphomonas johnsonii MHS-2 TaxID=1280950 RepID=A0A059FUD9_9PROT|nr:acyl-CoA dehydrogenase family protein [Hyphomonas johnsonii]KCZ94227.1 acyl-CoA dehydrogenase domain-containing protein [Hyphomonas johnsonii MHS-2]
MWNFSTDPEFQEKLDWMKEFVHAEVEPLDLVFNEPGHHHNVTDRRAMAAVRPLQQQVRKQGLWACHLTPELGGQGYGQVKLALMNEILGGTNWGPRVFGCQAPDSGNAEILAHFGTEAQKEKYLQPLLQGDITSCYSMTEPQGGSDPRVFETTAVKDGNDWVINGKKWFSSQARWASFIIVMAVTDRDAPPSDRYSMFLVERGTMGVNIIRNSGLAGESEESGAHAYIHYDNVRVPADAILGQEGKAFDVAQVRLGGGRIHHAMRTLGAATKAYEMMKERAVSRFTQGSALAQKQSTLQYIAQSYVELLQFRLLVLHAAWTIDQGDKESGQIGIGSAKIMSPRILQDIVGRAIQLHGSLGISNELVLGQYWIKAAAQGLVDGPTEIHEIKLAKRLLKDVKPAKGLFPTEHIPTRKAAAYQKLKPYLEMSKEDLA